MSISISLSHILVVTGCLLLALTALVHVKAGYPRLTGAISTGGINLPSFSADTRKTMSCEELKVMWLSFSAHLLVLSVLAFVSAWGASPSRAAIIICGIVPVIDAFLLKYFIKGVHLGAPLLAVSGLLIVLGGLYI